MATALTHIWLLVADIARARDFYRDTLGIELLSDHHRAPHGCAPARLAAMR
ncbi:MAG TPA: VOC family protein [Ktedonobacterales bacterium]|nr:VOC family protein [Ktedonobacterales bacterium]